MIEANLPGTLADVDAEFLHDLRVSVRRSRAVQRELKRVFPPTELRRFRDEFRWLQRVDRGSRDLDVYVLEFDSMRSLVAGATARRPRPAAEVLAGRRLLARGEMVQALRSARTGRSCVGGPRSWPSSSCGTREGREDAARPIGELAGERIAKVYKRMVRWGGRSSSSRPAEDYHELRKKGKELRYLLELFGAPLFPGEVVKPMIKSLKALQDMLGRHQDREVQVAMLRSLRDEVAALPGGPAALMAMGVLVERLERGRAGGAGRVRGAVRGVRLPRAAAAGQGDVRVSRVLATYNIKGGVGKTSAAVNLAYLAARDGGRTLLWDLDPQGASTFLFRVRPKVRGGARKLVRLQDAGARRDQGHRPSGARPAARPTSPTATWTWRSTASSARPGAGAGARAAARGVRLHLPRLPAEHLAGLRERVRGRRRAARPDHPGDAVLADLRAARAIWSPTAGPQVLAFFSMVEVRKSLHREVMAALRARTSVTMLGAAIPAADEVERMGVRARRRGGVRPRRPGGDGLRGAVVGREAAAAVGPRRIPFDASRWPTRQTASYQPSPPTCTASCCSTAAASTRA